ncbi:aminoacyl-tRNA hydrolase family protein [Blattabacterium cuenoti]|uniref:hypothetical protein n=1 Tax=Blattabacterium cuenoti TaxID=1653831 RepID=UPI0021D2D1DB|nr:hypothetical protein [Blattabacterium cuenoti]
MKFFIDQDQIHMSNSIEKFLIVGLGNPGDLYKKTRHNLGFMILDQLSKKYFFSFSKRKLGFISSFSYDDKLLFFFKTFYLYES